MVHHAEACPLAQALSSTEYTASGESVEDEMRDYFDIGVASTSVVPKLLGFEGMVVDNRGGSAAGLGSVRIALAFRP